MKWRSKTARLTTGGASVQNGLPLWKLCLRVATALVAIVATFTPFWVMHVALLDKILLSRDREDELFAAVYTDEIKRLQWLYHCRS